MMTRHVCVLIVAGALAGGAARPSAAPDQAPPPLEAARPDDPPPAYAYESHGRRDPFVSLVARGRDPRVTASRPPGPAGLLIGEVTVRGIVQDRSGFIAMIHGPDRKTFIVRAGEGLLDGSIKAITGDAIVFAQEVTDPLATVKQKEVRKSVRPAEGGRP